MKIKEIRFFNAVKVGAGELTVAFNYDIPGMPGYEIEMLEDRLGLIRLTCPRTKKVAYSSVYNMTWCVEEDVIVNEQRPKDVAANGRPDQNSNNKRPLSKTK